MPTARSEFADYVIELMAGWSTVTARKMFGGYGLYREELMFALILDDELFFKTDAGNIPQFEKEQCRPFIYQSKTRTVQMSYWSAPPACLESPPEMGVWCQSAYAAALRNNVIKSSSRTKKASVKGTSKNSKF